MKNNIIELVKYLPFKDYILNNENASKSIKLSKLMDNDYNPYISIPITLDNNDCIICLSNENKNHNHIVNIKDHSDVFKMCNCNYHIHTSCLINHISYNDIVNYNCIICKKLCIPYSYLDTLCLNNFDNIDLTDKSKQYILNYKNYYKLEKKINFTIKYCIPTVFILLILLFSYLTILYVYKISIVI